MADHKPKGCDASLVDTIVGQVKSQGLFDKFRRECLADVDTKPAFQNLRQLVENTVNKFLSKQEWTPELNKNQLREKMRKNIIEMNFLEAGVERIVDQVVNPKVSTVFQPNIEEMVYKHLGIEQPKVEKLEPPGLSELRLENAPCLQEDNPAAAAAAPPLPPTEPPATDVPSADTAPVPEDTDMLPTDLEAVSSPELNNPGTADNSPQKEEPQSKIEQTVEEDDVKMEVDDEESPPFEPILVEVKPPLPPAMAPPEECMLKTESQESDISGLTSQDSIESEHEVAVAIVAAKESVAEEPTSPHPETQKEEEIKVEAVDSVAAIECSPVPMKDDSQLSQVSSDTQNSIKYDQNTSTEEPLKMDISEEAQMPSRFPVAERNANNEVLTSFDLQKEAITFEQAKKRETEDDTLPEQEDKGDTDSQASETNTTTPPPPPLPPQPPADDETPSAPPVQPPLPATDTDAEVAAAGEESAHDPMPTSNVCPSGEVNKILVKASVPEETEDSLLDSGDSMDLKIVETDSRGSVSASNQSADTRESKKDDRSRSTSHRRTETQNRSSSSSTSHKGSGKSSRDRDKEREREKERDRDKDRSRHRGREHGKSDRSKGRKESDRKRDKDKDKDRDKERKNGDSCRDRTTERRSTDRDSNDGANSGGGPPKGVSNGGGEQKPATSTTSSGDNQKATPASPKSSSGQTTRADEGSASSPTVVPADQSDRVQQPIVVDQFLDGKELNLQMKVPSPTKAPSPVAGVLKKPKIADNLKEAMKLMKVRKLMDLQRDKEEERAAVVLRNQSGLLPATGSDDGEESLHYFPEEDQVVAKVKESASEQWWNHVKAQNEEKELVNEVKTFLEGATTKTSMREDKPPPAKKMRPTETIAKKPINGLTQTATTTTAAATVATVTDFVDMEDYHEAEIVLDDLPAVTPVLTENNNVQTENKNYGLTFNKLGEWNTRQRLDRVLIWQMVAEV